MALRSSIGMPLGPTNPCMLAFQNRREQGISLGEKQEVNNGAVLVSSFSVFPSTWCRQIKDWPNRQAKSKVSAEWLSVIPLLPL